ncbi:ATP-binding protein [Planomonospora parontospora]|uniref:ATP-binding protein n=1 Tax=Planomonospora parontospora TaxID=58119 RepID=UPI00167144E4|nr:ATP-binding protein [Planomonospora parontospora]GGL05848.1 hypothetical protein GCM10014719_05170 [Planomonospora parontospora subsp. antibiotica]GII14267.1 hypothetical protein Ppa05_09930 [Planomonospora parontospora subsp. antibiotica]
MPDLVPRLAEAELEDLMRSFRIVIVNGPRQSGKITLLEQFQRRHGGVYRTLDDEAILNAALDDPATFARQEPAPVLIDEIQRGGDSLLRAIKRVVDQNRDRGQFILSGSARFLTVPTLSESLAGRAALIELWPLAVSERVAASPDFLLRAFTEPRSLLVADSRWSRADYLRVTVEGGYPELLFSTAPSRRARWFRSYVTMIATRDIREFATIRHQNAIPRLLSLLAASLGCTIVNTHLSQAMEQSWETTRNYLSYVETVFLTARLSPWSTNLTSRIVKSPKIYLTDPGLAAHLLDADPAGLLDDDGARRGQLVETFVVNELRKQLGWSRARAELFHFRDRDGGEVDIIVERPDGRIVGIEVKSGLTVTGRSFTHLSRLRDRLGDAFVHGYVLSFSPDPLPFGDRLTALPISYLWQAG